ncbi:MAG TPA: NADPH-dependent F420 reductase [Vicinamibacterales bacterium]|nr:NADPH-dependent F420 reductase [Vicinamibacterales bacterium]
MTSIAILGGTGQQGRGLAQRFARAGAHVIVGSRDPERARDAVASWGATAQAIEVASHADAIRRSDVTVIAVPFVSVDALLLELEGAFKPGSVVVDVTVPVTFAGGKMAMLEVAEGSATEHIRARVPAGVSLACAFKTTPAHLLGEGDTPLDCDEFVCADTDEARARAIAMVELVPGLRPVDVGPLSRARFIEHATALAIAVNRRHKIHDARFRIAGL